MATETSSIDDILTNSNPAAAPSAPEQIDDNYNYDSSSSADDTLHTEIEDEPSVNEPEESDENTNQEQQSDEYGNAKSKPKTYTEDEVNERINKAVRERLARANNQPNQQTNQQQLQQKAGEFEYDPNSEGNWQQQLESFVEQTFTKMTQKQAQMHQQQMEQAAEAEFVDKFSAGMERFMDFRDVVGAQPITDPMTLALRGVGDPAAFIYAASKRHPAELERISKLKDPYSQMVEMGKLEERMRKKPEGTKAPRPIGRSSEDSTMNYVEKKVKEDSIEDLIHKSEAKKLEKLRKIRGK
jgi:hypothetical protein